MSEDVHPIDVLTPTVASVGFCLAGLAVALFFIVLPRLGGDAILGLIFGKDASLSLINSSKESYGPMIESLLGNDLLGRAVVFGLWAFVGLCTFVLITTAMSFIGAADEQRREMTYVHGSKGSLIRNDLISVVYRVGIAALWAGTLVIFIRYILSYFAVTGFVAFGGGSLVDWVLFGVASSMVCVFMHVQVVFARLIVGKTRLWNE